jgi:hypothetical protein
MTSAPKNVQAQALEAINSDIVGLWWLYKSIQSHAQPGLLILGTIPSTSMFVVESYQSLVSMFPKFQSVLSKQHADLLRESRHRAKLLDDSKKSIDEVVSEIAEIARQHRKRFFEPHTGILGPVKRLIQPDLGLYIYEGHVFSTTHAIDFGFGPNVDPSVVAFSFGKAIGAYLSSLIFLLESYGGKPFGPSALSDEIEMRDIKYKALYQRGSLGNLRLDYAAGLVLVLSNLNYVHYILRTVLPARSLTLFRLKFLTAYHANASITMIQNRIMGSGPPSEEIQQVFRSALGNDESRWLRKRGKLRNLLTHYLVEESLANELPPNATRVQTIEHLGGNLTYDKIDSLIDRYITRLSNLLEQGFQLSGDPFWYGKVT